MVDRDKVFIASASLDPRSLRINTEMGLPVRSPALNAKVRAAVAPGFLQANAWALAFSEQGRVVWVAENVPRTSQPAGSFRQRTEDWFFARLPTEGET